MSRFSPGERLERIERDLEAISALLWQSPYLLGEQPTAADMSVGPMQAAMQATPADTDLTRRIKRDRVVTSYLDQLEQAIPLS